VPTEVAEMPNVAAVQNKSNWDIEKATRLFYKFIHPSVKDKEQRNVKSALVGWLMDKEDMEDDDEIDFNMAEFNKINQMALQKLGNSTLKDLAVNETKYGAEGIASKDTGKDLPFGWKWTNLRGEEDEDIKEVDIDTVLEYQKNIQKGQNSLAKLKKEKKQAKGNKDLEDKVDKKIKRQEKAIGKLQQTLTALREKNYDNDITLNQAVTNLNDAEGFFTILSLSPEAKSDAAKALAIVTDVEKIKFEDAPDKFEELYGVPYRDFKEAKAKAVQGIYDLESFQKKRLQDVSRRTMEVAFEHRDKEEFPTDTDFSAYLQEIDDEEWNDYFTRLTTKYKSKIDEELPEGTTLATPEIIEEKLDEPRARKTKLDEGGEEFLQKSTPFSQKELLAALQEQVISASPRKKSSLKDNVYKVFVTSTMTVNWLQQFADKIGAKTTEAITQLRKQNPTRGRIRIREDKLLDSEIKELFPGIEHKQTFDHLIRNIKDFGRRSQTTLEQSIDNKVSDTLNLYWKSLDTSAEILDSLSLIDNVENHIDLTGYDKDFWDRYDNLNSFKRYVLGLAVAGSGERKLLDQLKNMQEGINSLWKYLEKIDDLEDDDEEDVEDSTEMDDMSDKEVKDLARAYGIKGVRNKSISELRQEVEMLRLKEVEQTGDEEEEVIAGEGAQAVALTREGDLLVDEEEEEEEEEDEELLDITQLKASLDATDESIDKDYISSLIDDLDTLIDTLIVVVKRKKYSLNSGDMTKKAKKLFKVLDIDEKRSNFMLNLMRKTGNVDAMEEDDKASLRTDVEAMFNTINSTWRNKKEEILTLGDDTSDKEGARRMKSIGRFELLLNTLNFKEILANNLYKDRVFNNIYNAAIEVSLENVVISLNFLEGSVSITGNIDYEIKGEYKPVVRQDPHITQRLMGLGLTSKDKTRLKNFFGERLLQTGQVQEPSLTMYGQTLGEEKKSSVNKPRHDFVKILVENYRRLNQAVNV
tara:strand:- start:698 stop:3631 length:2934 start_codon:yes stop_codon:yes gene_type:complete